MNPDDNTTAAQTSSELKLCTLNSLVLTKIYSYLSDDDLARNNLSMTCRFFHDFSSPDRIGKKLLWHIVRGEPEDAEKILRQYPAVFFYHGTVSYCGRTFLDISPFQLATWSLNMPMWIMMLNCIPQNEQGDMIKI